MIQIGILYARKACSTYVTSSICHSVTFLRLICLKHYLINVTVRLNCHSNTLCCSYLRFFASACKFGVMLITLLYCFFYNLLSEPFLLLLILVHVFSCKRTNKSVCYKKKWLEHQSSKLGAESSILSGGRLSYFVLPNTSS